MKLAQIEQGGQTILCARTAEGLIPLNGVGYHTMMDAIERIDELPRALEMAEAKETPLAPEDARFLPVVSRPGKIVCVGVNYGRHVKECGQSLPDAPVLFSKFATALSAHKDSVAIPRGVERLDYEAELVMVIGRRAHCVSADEAMDYVFGCTCGNDLSARDWQSRSSQWLAGKTPDGFAPVGPWITTIDAMHEIQDLELCVERHDARAGRSDLHRNAGRRDSRPAGGAAPVAEAGRRAGGVHREHRYAAHGDRAARIESEPPREA